MFARLYVRLRKPMEVDSARSLFRDPRYLMPHDPSVLPRTVFAASEAAVSAFVVYCADNGGYVVIILWTTGFALEAVVEPGTAQVRRAVDQAWPAIARTLENQRPVLDDAYLVEQGTDDELERGLLAFRSYVRSAFSGPALATAVLTLVLSVILAVRTNASVESLLLAAASALSVFVVGVWNGVSRFRSKKLVWEKLR